MQPTLHERRRILVVGSGGAGKSTFARQLGELIGLPVVHLDRHFWRPGWKATPTAEWNETVAHLAAAPEWIMDRNFGGSLAIRGPRCDAVVFFDFPRLICLWGVAKRWFRFRGQARPDMTEGCPEHMSLEFLLWIWRYPGRSRQRMLTAFANAGHDVLVIRVRSRRDVAEVLEAARPKLPNARLSVAVLALQAAQRNCASRSTAAHGRH